MFYMNGIDINQDAMSSIPGLYASGQSVGNVRGDITAAAGFRNSVVNPCSDKVIV